MKRTTYDWTEERMDTLRSMWTEGNPSSQIAKALGGGITRNAVMGKINRMGLMCNSDHNLLMKKRPLGACRASMMKAAGRFSAEPILSPSEVVEETTSSRSVDAGSLDPVPAVTVSDSRSIPSYDAADHGASTVSALTDGIGSVDPDESIVSEAVSSSVATSSESGTGSSIPETVSEEIDGGSAGPSRPNPSSTSSSSSEGSFDPSVPQTAVDREDLHPATSEASQKRLPRIRKVVRDAKASLVARRGASHLERASRSFRAPEPQRVPEIRELAEFRVPSQGFMARVKASSGVMGDADYRTAVSFVKELGGGIFDSSRRAHQAALVAIATIISRGDPRRILVPFMSEPNVLQMMRRLAEKSIVVGGKTPDRWQDEQQGDRAFFDDVLAVEGPLRPDAFGVLRAA